MTEDYNANLSAEEKRGHVFLIVRRIIAYVVLVAVCLAAIFPFYVLVINTTRLHMDILTTFSLLPGAALAKNINTLINDGTVHIIQSMLNSVIVAAVSCVCAVYISALTAYGIYAYDFKFKNVANTFIMVVLMVPTQVSALGYVDMMKTWGFYNEKALPALIFQFIAMPAVFFFMKQYMESALPLEIVEAGRIDGGHEFYIFNRVVLPIMKPAVAVQAIFVFVQSWNSYFMPQLLMNLNSKAATMPLAVAVMNTAAFDKQDLGELYATLAFAVVPLIVVYLALSKYIIRGIALGSVKG